MSVVWIVHRDPTERAALARLAAAPEGATLGAPGDVVFGDAPAPDAIVLGLAGDLEVELEFAHRAGPAARSAQWILVGDRERLARAKQLFDVLPASYCVHPPEPTVLRRAIEAAARHTEAQPLALSQRPARDILAQRFARAFADLDPRTLLRALDPRLADVPLLLLGEPGSGRATLARYVHHFGGTAGGAFVELPCSPETTSQDLLARISAAHAAPGADRAVTLWLADPGRLLPDLQHVVRSWIEFGLPAETAPCRVLRWIATDTGLALEPSLRRALSGLSVQVPPLRERPSLIANLVAATADAWCRSRGVAPRRFAEHALAVLEEYPWPGNLRELEAVVEQSLAGGANDPLGPEDLVLDGEPLAPFEPAARAERLAPPPPTREPPSRPELVREEPNPEVEALLESLGPEEPAEATPPAAAAPDPSLRRLAAAVGHELRNPLTAIRTFSALLPERHADPEFRVEFARLVGENLVRAEEVVARLERLAELGEPRPEAVELTALLEETLDKRRERIRARRLVVLEELDPARPTVRCDPRQLRLALDAVLDKTLSVVPERGDVYLASRRLETGLRGGPCVRVLLRFRGPHARHGDMMPDVAPAANALDYAIADLLLRAQGGSLTLDASDRGETVVLIDLPA